MPSPRGRVLTIDLELKEDGLRTVEVIDLPKYVRRADFTATPPSPAAPVLRVATDLLRDIRTIVARRVIADQGNPNPEGVTLESKLALSLIDEIIEHRDREATTTAPASNAGDSSPQMSTPVPSADAGDQRHSSTDDSLRSAMLNHKDIIVALIERVAKLERDRDDRQLPETMSLRSRH
jgi:hypothetical protein